MKYLGGLLMLGLLLSACGDTQEPSDVNNPSLTDADGDGLTADEDCDDNDEDVTTERTFYRDIDADGLGDGRTPVRGCQPPPGFVDNADDLEPECATNDTDDCGVCAGPGGQIFYADVDRDGLGDARIPVEACSPPGGFVTNADDQEPECTTNDTDECGICGGGNADKDCNGICFGPSELDECGVCDGPGTDTYYADADEDGLGDPEAAQEACEQPEGFVANADDLEPECTTNDTDDCGVCAGPGATIYYPDTDEDGLGDPRSPMEACEQPEGFVLDNTDEEPECTTNDTDDCGVCAGENADKDCNDQCFGEAFVDGCERCAGGDTGLEPAIDDFDDDGVPDLCDGDCLTQRRLIVQWTDVPTFNNAGGGPYTFQVVLSENGDILFQYGILEPFGASATVGIQSDGGEHNIEFSFENDFILETPAIIMMRERDDRFIADYNQAMYWLDIRNLGTAIALGDDADETIDIGFSFPFYDQVFEQITISSNGFLAFNGPFGGFRNSELPNEGLGAMIAPLWDDLNPGGGGSVHVYMAEPTCNTDCNGVVGGFAEPEEECGSCLTGLEQGPLIDCNGICGGDAEVDGCGICAGGDTGIEPRTIDCNGICGGDAFYDQCRVCVGGDTGREPTDPELCPEGVDMVIDNDYMRETVRLDYVQVPEDDCLIQERCVRGPGNRKVIRFGTRIANIGTEDLVLGAPSEDGEFWHFDECHSHYHFEAYAAYEIYDVANERMLDEIGSKNGFCVLDSGVYDPNIATDGCFGYGCGNQGITAGCQDTYGAGLQCQWIDVTDLPDGEYDLLVTTNPEQEIPEINHDNNSARVRVRMTGDLVEVID